MRTIQCERCGVDVLVTSLRSHRRFCTACAKEHGREMARRSFERRYTPHPRVIHCETCGTEMKARSNTQRFCPKCSAVRYRQQSKAASKRWKEEHPDRVREANRRYNAKHNPLYWAAHRDELLERSRQYRIEHREEFRAYDARYSQQHKHLKRCREANRRAKKYGAEGELTAAQLRQLEHDAGGHCYYCDQEAELVTEHMQPLICGGSNTIANVVMACNACNRRKGAMSADEFLAALWDEIDEADAADALDEAA